MIRNLFTTSFFLSFAFLAQAQYTETFGTADRGYLENNSSNFTGVDWTMTAWNAPARDMDDYFKTIGGLLEGIDVDEEVCWQSPVINISVAGMVSIEADLEWVGFDKDVGDPGDYISLKYSVDGGAYTTVSNQFGGGSNGTVNYGPGTFTDQSSMGTVTASMISGSTLEVRVCGDINSNQERFKINEVRVPEPGASTGCGAPLITKVVSPAGSCNGINGEIKVTATGATPGYNVAWSGPSSGNPAGTEIASSGGMYSITPLASGTYTITVTDAASCSATTSATVTTAAAMALSTQVLASSCAGSDDGEIDLTVNNGVPPFSYSWSNLPGAGDPEDQINLAPGTYTVTVTDNAGCTALTSATVNVSTPGAYLETFSINNKGYLLDLLEDFVGVNWTLSNWPLDPTGRAAIDYFRTSGGVLTGVDLDEEVCWVSPVIDINPPGSGVAFSVDLAWTGFDDIDYINVKYSIDGGAYTTVPNQVGGGTGTIEYPSGNEHSGSTTVSVSGISGSTLQIQVCGDMNASPETISIDNVSVPLAQGLACAQEINIKQAATNILDGGSYNYGGVILGANNSKVFTIENLGDVTLNLTGTPPNYVVKGGANPGDFTITQPATSSITGGNSTTFTVQFTPGGLGARSCTLSIANNDSNEDPYNITLNGMGTCPPITFTGTPTGTCSGSSNGQIVVSGVSGGTGPYTYSKDNGSGYQPGATFTGLAASTYQVVVKDANGCTSGATPVIVSSLPLPTATISGTLSFCTGSSTTLTASGAGGGSYLWDDASTNAMRTVSAGGTYTVQVTDINGCTDTEMAMVTENPLPTVNCPSNITVCAGSAAFALAGGSPGGGSYSGMGVSAGMFDPTTAGVGTHAVTYAYTDVNGCSGSCMFDITVENCNIDFSGKIVWENDDVSGVKDATVNLTGSSTMNDLTDINGDFMIATGLTSGSFTLKPTKNINKLNGVTVGDVLAIQQHVTLINVITDPYKLVCADVNKSNSISTLDAALISQSLLGNPQASAQFNTSWRFVPSTHTMMNPPWGFPEQRTYTAISGPQTNQDFIGMKIGDVTGDANPASFGGSQALVLRTPDQLLQIGETLDLIISADQSDDLAAFQFGLSFDPAKLQFEDIQALTGLPLTVDNFGLYNVSEGEIRTVWAQTTGLQVEESTSIIHLRFSALQSGVKLSEVLQLNDAVLPGLAYTSKLAESAVELRFNALTGINDPVAVSGLRLRVQPNPFREETTVSFTLPEACEAQLRVFDVNGRELLRTNKTYPAGNNSETLRLEGITASAVLTCELLTPFGVATRKLVAVGQ